MGRHVKMKAADSPAAASPLSTEEGVTSKKVLKNALTSGSEASSRLLPSVAEPLGKRKAMVDEEDDIVKPIKKKIKKPIDDEEDDVKKPIKKEKTKRDVEEDEIKLLRTIFVGNLPTTVKKSYLIREFSKFGRVDSARIRSVPLVDSKLPRKAAVITGQVNENRSSMNAYVVFKEEASAKAALAHNMSEFQGNHIRVDMATAPRKEGAAATSNGLEYDPTRSIFLGNVPFDVEEEDLYKVFVDENPWLNVEAIRVPRDSKTSIGKGFGFVLFKTQGGAAAALARGPVKLGERTLRVAKMGFQQRLKSASKPNKNNGGPRTNNSSAGRLRISGQESLASTKGPLPWEGTRSTKSDGRPGKVTLGQQDKKRSGPGSASSSHPSGPAQKVKQWKRPAVAARKQAELVVKSGGALKPESPNSSGQKRKKNDNGRKGGLKGKGKEPKK